MTSKEVIEIILARYDKVSRRGLSFNASNFMFGLSTEGCCSIQSARDFEESRKTTTNSTKIVEIEGVKAVRSESLELDGDKLLRYQIPFSSKYNLYFNLRIYAELVRQVDVVRTRVEMVDQTVRDFISINATRLKRANTGRGRD